MRLDARRMVVGPSGGGSATRGASAGLRIPFDFAASFTLSGVPGRVVEAVINTDVDGVFVAEAISYGFEASAPRPAPLHLAQPFDPAELTLGQIPAAHLIRGVRIAPEALDVVFPPDPNDPVDGARVLRWPDRLPGLEELPAHFGDTLLEPADTRGELSFLFSMIDTASGRELQDEPTHSIASLGSADGHRPFRRLAPPMTFRPRSTLRLQVIELTPGAVGTLQVVLLGHKQLQLGSCPDQVRSALYAFQELQQGGVPSGRVIPFDYVASVELRGVRGRTEVVEVPVNVEGGFVATALGYGLLAAGRDVAVAPPAPGVILLATSTAAAGGSALGAPGAGAPVDLDQLPLGSFAPDALLDGIRLRPELVRLALLDTGKLATVSADTLQILFERLNRFEDVSFRYRIHDTGTGRDLQNRPIHNLAGLGSADGRRPFRTLGHPLVLLPGSVLRVTIEERRGRGRLYLVFQGFKVLASAAAVGSAVPLRRRVRVRR